MKALQFTVIFLLLILASHAQPLTGNKSIPGDYARISDAILALNLNGTSAPGVTFNIASGFVENESTSSYQFLINTATGSSTAPIVFRKVPGGAVNPRINVNGGAWGSSTDAGLIIAGTDYVTIDGIDIWSDNSIEWGYALLKKSSTAPFDGCQNAIIRNCTITLNKTNPIASSGIYAGNHIAGNTTALTITATTDALNNCKFYNNIISNTGTGITLSGYNASSPYSLYDQNNQIGVDGANVISDYGNVFNPSGIYVNYQQNVNIANNTITTAPGAVASYDMHGIWLGAATTASATVSNNTISISCTGGSNIYGIYSGFGASGISNTLTFSNNSIQN